MGIGLRVAGRVAGRRLEGTHTAVNLPHVAMPTAALSRAAGQAAGLTSKNVARGVGGFLKPFRRVGSILWLEVTGVFFLLPVIVFTPNLWRMRASWEHGPEHRMFLLTLGVVVVFLYLGVTSFWRARKK